MTVSAITKMSYWTCPECKIPNSIFLIEGESIQNRLSCSFCEHESGFLEWKEDNGE